MNVDLKRGNSCGSVCNERGKCVETTLQDGDRQKGDFVPGRVINHFIQDYASIMILIISSSLEGK